MTIYGPINEEKANKYYTPAQKFPEPKEIYDYLSKYVIGQEEVKKALSVNAVRHLYSSNFNERLKKKDNLEKYLPEVYTLADSSSYDCLLKKQNLMIIGQSGTGKTLCITRLANASEIILLDNLPALLTGSGIPKYAKNLR